MKNTIEYWRNEFEHWRDELIKTTDHSLITDTSTVLSTNTKNKRRNLYLSPVEDNFGKEDGDCVYYALEEVSWSYNIPEYNADWWKRLAYENGFSGTVVDSPIKNSVSGVDWGSIAQYIGISNVLTARHTTNPHLIIDAFNNDKRVLIAKTSEKNKSKGHMALVRALEVWDDGHFRLTIAETSPIRKFTIDSIKYNFDKPFPFKLWVVSKIIVNE